MSMWSTQMLADAVLPVLELHDILPTSIKGTNAFVEVSIEGQTRAAHLTYTDGAWRIHRLYLADTHHDWEVGVVVIGVWGQRA
jgi:hypothetical protein